MTKSVFAISMLKMNVGEKMFKRVGFTILMLLGFLVGVSSAVELTCFEDSFVRGSGQPITKYRSFPGIAGPAILKIYNGADDDSYEKVSSSIISINGIDIATPEVFNQNVDYVEVPVDLQEGTNNLAVQLKSKPGGKIRIGIFQEVEAEAAAFIGPQGGIIEVVNQNSPLVGTKLFVPDGALSKDIALRITASDFPPASPKNYIFASTCIEFGPDKTTFEIPAEVTFQYNDIDSNGIVDGTDIVESKLTAAYFDKNYNKWYYLKKIKQDIINNSITFEINHFTQAVLMGNPNAGKTIVYTIDGLSFLKVFGDIVGRLLVGSTSPLFGIITDDWIHWSRRNNYLKDAILYSMPDLNFDSSQIVSFSSELSDIDSSWDGNANDTPKLLRNLITSLGSASNKAIAEGSKFIVVSHSWGTVLGYLALEYMPWVEPDLFLTLSSPLGSMKGTADKCDSFLVGDITPDDIFCFDFIPEEYCRPSWNIIDVPKYCVPLIDPCVSTYVHVPFIFPATEIRTCVNLPDEICTPEVDITIPEYCIPLPQLPCLDLSLIDCPAGVVSNVVVESFVATYVTWQKLSSDPSRLLNDLDFRFLKKYFDTEERGPNPKKWINYWDNQDIISGPLELLDSYFEDRQITTSLIRTKETTPIFHAITSLDGRAKGPISNHDAYYWEGETEPYEEDGKWLKHEVESSGNLDIALEYKQQIKCELANIVNNTSEVCYSGPIDDEPDELLPPTLSQPFCPPTPTLDASIENIFSWTDDTNPTGTRYCLVINYIDGSDVYNTCNGIGTEIDWFEFFEFETLEYPLPANSLSPETEYTWTVFAINEAGDLSEAPVLWYFTTADSFCADQTCFRLPDTGQTTCYDNSSAIPCPLPGEQFYGQDANYNINSPYYLVSDDSLVVRDNNTGLTWQREDDKIYRSWDTAFAYCENLNLASYSDWRLPSRKELVGIVDYSRFGPALDTAVFSDIISSSLNNTDYWSSTAAPNPGYWWFVEFHLGLVSVANGAHHGHYVRCVRSEQ